MGSLAVFAASLILLAIFNFKHINWENLDSITLQSIAIRVMLNIPLLWLATVANINLNKYSRLEQEYGHKEALAKSYEKYRDEISKLPSLDTEVDDPAMATLHAELIKLNLEAFKKIQPMIWIKLRQISSLIDFLMPETHQKKVLNKHFK